MHSFSINGFKKKQYKYAGQPYAYRGLISCADCGLSITPEKHKGHVYYHCTQYKGKHDAKWLREEEITNQIGMIFKRLRIPQDILEQVRCSLNQLHQDKIEFHNKHYDRLMHEHKSLTKMLDNLYLDKLKGRITDDEYDRFYQTLRAELTEITVQLERLQEAEDNYYVTSKYLLDLASRAYELFAGSEAEEKRLLIKLVLSNLSIKDENIVYDVQKPFDLLLECSDRQLWCA